LLYGPDFWKDVINFDGLVRHGMISPEDANLFQIVDDPAQALAILQGALTAEVPGPGAPAFAHSRTCEDDEV
jgi:predicted Rossmann-fold nucleotide-binding protein